MSAAADTLPEASDLVIEEARREDLPAIVAILASDRMFGERDSADPVYLADYERAFDEIAANPYATLYVARRGGVVVGTFEMVLFHALLRHGRKLAIVEAVHVAPDARGGGVGGAMMRFAMDEARRRGAGSLQLVSSKERLDAHRFYDRIGFDRRVEGFKMEL